MKLILLYGPPAVGKLTIAKELAERTGYTLFHNHLVLNVIRDLFGYTHPARRILEYEFRLRIIEEAAKADLNMIVTTGGVGPDFFDRFREIIQLVEKYKGECLLVRLTAPKDVLLARVEDSSRKPYQKINSREDWETNFKKHPGLLSVFPDREHLSIDTGVESPKEAVKKIMEYYEL